MTKFAKEFLIFGIKQAWACLFGGIMLALIIASKFIWQNSWELARYDFLFIAAIIVQLSFLKFKLETIEEAKVIFIFHIVGTIMEIFKTHMGSWIYPEENLLRIGGVPLFSGFMYSCVGSYIARATKVLKLRYTNYPSKLATIILCALIYINFFTHHYIFDFRYFLFAATAYLFFRTKVHFTVYKETRWMPLLVGFFLVSFFIWIAENISTFSDIWIYPTQKTWHLVSLGKLGSWYLLMILSFVLVSLVHKPKAS